MRAEAELTEHQEQAAFNATVERAREVEGAYLQALRQVWDAARDRGHARTFGEAYAIDKTIMSLCRLNSFTGLETMR